MTNETLAALKKGLNTALTILNLEFDPTLQFNALESEPASSMHFDPKLANQMAIVNDLPVGTKLKPDETRHILIGIAIHRRILIDILDI